MISLFFFIAYKTLEFSRLALLLRQVTQDPQMWNDRPIFSENVEKGVPIEMQGKAVIWDDLLQRA